MSPTNVELNFTGLPDSHGNFSYKMLISKEATLGQYMVNAQTIAPSDTHDNTLFEISTQNFIVGRSIIANTASTEMNPITMSPLFLWNVW